MSGSDSFSKLSQIKILFFSLIKTLFYPKYSSEHSHKNKPSHISKLQSLTTFKAILLCSMLIHFTQTCISLFSGEKIMFSLIMTIQGVLFFYLLCKTRKSLTVLIFIFVLTMDLKYELLKEDSIDVFEKHQNYSSYLNQASLLVVLAMLCIKKSISFILLLTADFLIRSHADEGISSFSQAVFITFLTGLKFFIDQNFKDIQHTVCDEIRKDREYLLRILQQAPVPVGIYLSDNYSFLLKNKQLNDWQYSGNSREFHHLIECLNNHQSLNEEYYKPIQGKWQGQPAITIFVQDYKKKIESLTKEFEKSTNEQLATATHELRTPLNALVGMLGCMNLPKDDLENQKYLDICVQSSRLLLSLTNSIIDLGQISSGTLTLNCDYIDSRKMVEDMKDILGFLANQKGISFSTKIENNSPSVLYTDKLRLQQVLTNLIGNAIKFTTEGSVSLNMSLDPEDQTLVQFTVSDTGSGIKEEDFHKLFRPFGKLRDTSSLNKSGAGLGLIISQNLVKALARNQDASISLSSKLNVGTTFTFSIPFKNPNQKDIDPCSELFEDSSLECSILEDEPTARDIVPFPPTSDSSFSTKYGTSPQERIIPKTDIICQKDHRLKSRMSIQIDPTKKTLQYLKSNHSTPFQIGAPLGVPRISSDVSVPGGESLAMLVDDNPFNLFALATVLRSFGVQSKTTFSGRNCIQIVLERARKAKCFDVIFLDYLMPDLDGAETTKVLKKMMANQQIPEIPIIGLTALHSPEDEKKCLEAGMSRVLRKPVDKEILMSVLKEVTIYR